jgi:hypothetical protein
MQKVGIFGNETRASEESNRQQYPGDPLSHGVRSSSL